MTDSLSRSRFPSCRSARAPSLLAHLRLETRYEFVKLLRQPEYTVPTLGFPVMFYLLFGILLGQAAGHAA